MMPEPKAKPFPWKCPSCLKVEVRPTTADYLASVKHEGRLHNVRVPKFRVPKCSACGEMLFGVETDQQIQGALRRQLGLLAPEEIRGWREQLGLTQIAFAEALGIANETVSRWESGALVQSRSSDNLMRLFFGIPAVRRALSDPNHRLRELELVVKPRRAS